MRVLSLFDGLQVWGSVVMLRIVLAGALALTSCAQRPPQTHEVYIWQRVWTAPLRTAVLEAKQDFTALRVLAAESDRYGGMQVFHVDIATLVAAGLPVTVVVRLNGTDPDVGAEALAHAISAVVAKWRDDSIDVVGVEIDHDCANAKLPAYAGMLRELRRQVSLPRLSITVLPTWLDVPALDEVLGVVDEAVLQVHAVQSPAQGLFASNLAEGWIRRFAARSPHPFRAALPVYGSAVDFDAENRPVAVESETPRDRTGVRREELRVAPKEVGVLLAALQRSPPPRLAGFVWFRLPLPDDRRVWSRATLRAVIAGRPLAAVFVATTTQGPSGAVDLALENIGDIDTVPTGAIDVIASGCEGDVLPGFRVEMRSDGLRLVAFDAEVLRAGRKRAVGWVRCAGFPKVQWHADP